MKLGPAERLVLTLARTRPSPTEAGEVAGFPPDLWPAVVRHAREQAVLLLLARRLAGPTGGLVPHEALEGVQREARAIAADGLRLTGVLLDIVARFARAGIVVLPFKGPTLARQAYGDVGLRTFADLDLLVHEADLEPAREILLGEGFRPSYPGTPARRALLVRRGSHESFERADGTLVELHWRIAAPISEFGLDRDRLWRRSVELPMAGRSVPALRPDDLLLVLALHGTKHAWERLAWICDVAELLRIEPDLDWDAVLAESDRMRCERALHLALALARELLAAPLPRSIALRLAADPALPGLLGHVRDRLFVPPRSGAGTFGFHLATRSTAGAKAALVLGSLTALNQRDLQVVSLPDAALPLYFLVRPVRLAGKAIAHAVPHGSG